MNLGLTHSIAISSALTSSEIVLETVSFVQLYHSANVAFDIEQYPRSNSWYNISEYNTRANGVKSVRYLMSAGRTVMCFGSSMLGYLFTIVINL
jgi:hypothetical protein